MSSRNNVTNVIWSMYVILSLIITYMYNVCAWNLTGVGMWWYEMVSNPCARHHDGWILHVFTLQKSDFRVLAAHSLAWFNTFFLFLLKTCKNTEFTRLKFEKSLDNIFLLSSTAAPYLSYTVLVALSLLSFSPSLRSSVFQGWPGGPWGKDVFTTSDWSSGTLSLSVRHSSSHSQVKTENQPLHFPTNTSPEMHAFVMSVYVICMHVCVHTRTGDTGMHL